MQIEIHKMTDGVPIRKAPAGSFAQIINGEYEGSVVKLPVCTNHAVVFMDKNIASSDRYYGMGDDVRVRILQEGDRFTVTI